MRAYIHTLIHHTYTYMHTDMQTGRHTFTQEYRHTYIYIHAHIQAGTHTERQAYIHTGIHTYRHSHTY